MPLFLADWTDVLFVHFEVKPEALQPRVPFALDLFDGRAFVSLVAFTMRRLRFSFGGRLGEAILRPLATTRFLNVRTYVRHGGEPAIYFIRELVSNRWSAPLGPVTYGLPYRAAWVDYRSDGDGGAKFRGTITARNQSLNFAVHIPPEQDLAASAVESLDEFLLERYTACTSFGGLRRLFRIWHDSWPQARVDVRLMDAGVLGACGPWAQGARLVRANYSPGVRGVWLGRPHLAR